MTIPRTFDEYMRQLPASISAWVEDRHARGLLETAWLAGRDAVYVGTLDFRQDLLKKIVEMCDMIQSDERLRRVE